MHPNFESGGGNYYNTCSQSHEFDLQADFCEFLKEAKSHTYDEEEESFKGTTVFTPTKLGETRKADLQGEGDHQMKNNKNKKKKSWKSTLFSWLKMEKKNKKMVKPLNVSSSSSTSNHRRGGIFSGPIIINGNGNGNTAAAAVINGRCRKPLSGPLFTALFNHSMREENDEILPYVCLNHHHQQLHENPHSFGPVYLVT